MASKVIRGDCRKVMARGSSDAIDAIITDPPYELKFMGRKWDASGIAFDSEVWAQAYRVLKPGGHVLAFGGTRTSHRLAVAIEDAGFEIRDTIMWLYGSGMPKAFNLKTQYKGEWCECEGDISINGGLCVACGNLIPEFKGFSSALKPAWEPIILARKSLIGTVIANVEEYGTGTINIDATRIPITDNVNMNAKQRRNNMGAGSGPGYEPGSNREKVPTDIQTYKESGRWPANLILDEEAGAMLDEQTGVLISGKMEGHYQGFGKHGIYGTAGNTPMIYPGDSGGASRFFYCAKASRSEKNAGLEGMPEQDARAVYNQNCKQCLHCNRKHPNSVESCACGGELIVVEVANPPRANHHPTVKPLSLLRYLVRLITPPGGRILDPFAGSGTTGCAAELEGFDSILIELQKEYIPIIKARVAHYAKEIS